MPAEWDVEAAAEAFLDGGLVDGVRPICSALTLLMIDNEPMHRLRLVKHANFQHQREVDKPVAGRVLDVPPEPWLRAFVPDAPITAFIIARIAAARWDEATSNAPVSYCGTLFGTTFSTVLVPVELDCGVAVGAMSSRVPKKIDASANSMMSPATTGSTFQVQWSRGRPGL